MTDEKIAEDLLFPLWRSVSKDYKAKYKFDAWQHFENFVITSANSADLKAFLTKLKRLIEIRIQQRFEKQILSVLQHSDGKIILNELRKNAPYLILLTRALNNQLKEDAYENYLYDIQLDYDFTHEEINEVLQANEGSYKKTFDYFIKKYKDANINIGG